MRNRTDARGMRGFLVVLASIAALAFAQPAMAVRTPRPDPSPAGRGRPVTVLPGCGIMGFGTSPAYVEGIVDGKVVCAGLVRPLRPGRPGTDGAVAFY